MIHTPYFLLMGILVLCLHSEGYQETSHIEIIVGQVFFLNCDTHVENMTVEWNREQNQSLDVGISVINESLWFLPAQESHTGNYSCIFSEFDGVFERVFSISVAKIKCPRLTPLTDQKFLYMDTTQVLDCKDGHMSTILQLNSISNVTWTLMKDCSPLSWHGNSGTFRFSVSEGEEGLYTCLLTFIHNGTLYTATHTMEVKINKLGPAPQMPRIVQPHTETLYVKLGLSYKLNCKAFVGADPMDPVEPIEPYWLVGTSHTENYPDLVTHSNCTLENGVWYCHCILSILEVQPEFLNVPFICIARNSVGLHNGTVTLLPASQREMYCGVLLLIAYTSVALGLLVFHRFKVDLVLAYRNLSPTVKRQSDGKLYDAYVCYIHANDQSTSASNFALHVLPVVLEEQLGYKLFIHGRDDLPGAAIHDVIAEAVGKSRRIIIVLPSKAFTKTENVSLLQETPPEPLIFKDIIAIDPHLSENSGFNWSHYEWRVGLYDVLVKEELQVILIQVGGEVDVTLLPETLQYVRHTQGMLKWKQGYATKSDGKFWKQLCYRMPPVPKTKVAAVV